MPRVRVFSLSLSFSHAHMRIVVKQPNQLVNHTLPMHTGKTNGCTQRYKARALLICL